MSQKSNPHVEWAQINTFPCQVLAAQLHINLTGLKDESFFGELSVTCGRFPLAGWLAEPDGWMENSGRRVYLIFKPTYLPQLQRRLLFWWVLLLSAGGSRAVFSSCGRVGWKSYHWAEKDAVKTLVRALLWLVVSLLCVSIANYVAVLLRRWWRGWGCWSAMLMVSCYQLIYHLAVCAEASTSGNEWNNNIPVTRGPN